MNVHAIINVEVRLEMQRLFYLGNQLQGFTGTSLDSEFKGICS